MARKTFLKCFRCNARCLLLLLACISSVLLLHSCKDGEDLQQSEIRSYEYKY